MLHVKLLTKTIFAIISVIISAI